jgi:hypothetical protein
MPSNHAKESACIVFKIFDYMLAYKGKLTPNHDTLNVPATGTISWQPLHNSHRYATPSSAELFCNKARMEVAYRFACRFLRSKGATPG